MSAASARAPAVIDALRCAIVVPCRNEAAVIARKLENLARLALPRAGVAHRVLIVDDGSGDRTAERARDAAEHAFAGRADVAVDVLANAHRPGKAGAIATALATLRDRVDLVVLTDADVLVAPGALVALAQAFGAEPELGMACGAQRFVRELPSDDELARGLERIPDVGGTYDRWTARVRRLESRGGRLFSVHGQWLAWRRELELEARSGVAADDLDLMLQARARGTRVRIVEQALFFERKADSDVDRDARALRRARAYVQVARGPRLAQACATARGLDRWQLRFYRRVPTATPWLAVLAVALAVAACAALSLVAAIVFVAGLAALAASPVGRRATDLLATIARAARAEAREAVSDRWETARR